MDWYHGDVGTSDPKTASGGNAASGRKWCRRLGRKNEWFCPQDAAVSDFSPNLTQRPHSLCFLDQHKEWGRLALGTGVLCGFCVQVRCYKGARSALSACRAGAVQVSAWCRHRQNEHLRWQCPIKVIWRCYRRASTALSWCRRGVLPLLASETRRYRESATQVPPG